MAAISPVSGELAGRLMRLPKSRADTGNANVHAFNYRTITRNYFLLDMPQTAPNQSLTPCPPPPAARHPPPSTLTQRRTTTVWAWLTTRPC